MHFPPQQTPWQLQQPFHQPSPNSSQQPPLPNLLPGTIPQHPQGGSSFPLPLQGVQQVLNQPGLQPGLFLVHQAGGQYLIGQSNPSSLTQQRPSLSNHPGQLPRNHPGRFPPNHPGQHPHTHPGQHPHTHPGQLSHDHPGQLPHNHPGQFPHNHPGQPPSSRNLLPPGKGSQIAPGHLRSPCWPPTRAVLGSCFQGVLNGSLPIRMPSNPPDRDLMKQGPQQWLQTTDERSTVADSYDRQAFPSKASLITANIDLGRGQGTGIRQTDASQNIEAAKPPITCVNPQRPGSNVSQKLRPPITEYFEKQEKLLGEKRSASTKGQSEAKKQRREAPKAPAWKSNPEEAVDVSNQFALEDVDEDVFKKVVEKEEDPHRLAQRQKQIDFGKNTLGYERYLELVPKSKRQKEHPRTPRIGQVCSKRSWDGQIKKWRRLLHQYDPPADGEAELAVQDFLPGYKERDSLDGVEKNEAESEEERGESGSKQVLVFEDDEDEFVGL